MANTTIHSHERTPNAIRRLVASVCVPGLALACGGGPTVVPDIVRTAARDDQSATVMVKGYRLVLPGEE